MKKIFLSAIVAAAAALPTFAAVDTLNYSAVVRDANGNAVANQEVTLMFQFLEDNDVKFEETAKVTTSAAGVVNYAIGSTQSLDGVDWNANNVKLVVSMDQNGGSDLKLVSDSNVASVPTALYALKSADSEMIYNDIDQLYGLNERNQAQLNNVAADFANLGENLDNFANEMDARFTEVNGQLENLNMVSAVVRENEEQIEKNTNEIEAVKKDAYDAFEDIYMQLGTLEQVVSAVEALDGWHRDNDETFLQMLNDVKKNATDIEGLMEDVDNIYGQNERTQSQLSNVAADIAGVKEDVDNLYGMNDRNETKFNDVFAKIAGVEEDINNLYGQNERTEGQLNNLYATTAENKEAIEAVKNDAYEAFEDIYKELGGIEKNATEIEAVKKDAYDAFEDIYKELGTLTTAVEALDAWHRENDENILQMLNDVKKNATDIEGIFEDIEALQGADERATAQFNNLVNDLGGVKEDIEALQGKDERFETQITQLQNQVAENLANYQEDFQRMADVSAEMGNAVTELRAQYEEDFQKMSEVSAEMGNAVTELRAQYEEDFQKMADTSAEMGNAVTELRAQYEEDFQRMADTSAEMGDAVNTLTEDMDEMRGTIERLQAQIIDLQNKVTENHPAE